MGERNYKAVVEYDGTEFHGWQKQEGLRTVQGELEKAIAKVLQTETQVHGAGRTDAGVHAFGQVCHFLLSRELSPDRIRSAVSSCLSPDIRIRALSEAPLSFHARFSAISRRYSYFVRMEPTALWRRFFHVIRYKPDLKAMRRAALLFIGEKDFAGFAAATKEKRSTVCWVKSVEIQSSGPVVSFHVEADHFLHKMVRTMVGTLLEVGRGRIDPEQIEEIICKKDRSLAGPTLPPQGLFLVEVKYPG